MANRHEREGSSKRRTEETVGGRKEEKVRRA
jgi:hypothetical protein